MCTQDDRILEPDARVGLPEGAYHDVTGWAGDLGFAVPVAYTRAAVDRYAYPPGDVYRRDPAGRLFDLLAMLRFAVRATRDPYRTAVRFTFHTPDAGADGRVVDLLAVCRPDDHGRPCLVVMLPEEEG